MLAMVILLSLLGSNLFIAVITYGYNQVVTREHLCKIRLGEISREQDGRKAMHHMQGDLQQISLNELLDARDLDAEEANTRAQAAMLQVKRLNAEYPSLCTRCSNREPFLECWRCSHVLCKSCAAEEDPLAVPWADLQSPEWFVPLHSSAHMRSARADVFVAGTRL